MGEPDETRSESPPWPEGPFAHNCLEENADAEGDFDGDGAPDRMRFEPAYASDGRVDWTIRLERGNGQASVSRVEAECPEVIGAVDIDGDGQDELFYDTGKGMTAALVDLLVFDGELLKNARHVPSDTQLYVGTDTAGSAGIGCFRNQDATGLVEVHLPPDGPVLLTVHLLEGDHLVRSGSTGDGVSNDRLADGEIDCFDLHWQGY
jgi:hypothetical protein